MADTDEHEKSEPESGERIDAASLQAENAALQERLLRALADAENTRRRAQRSVEDARQYATTDLARELLTVMDSLQLAIGAATEQPAAAEQAPLLDGIRATERLLSTILERFGVSRIEALGAPFDPALHEAILQTDDTTQVPGSVAQVVHDGYTIHDRLLRPARVIVAKRRPAGGSNEDGSHAGGGPELEMRSGNDGRGH